MRVSYDCQMVQIIQILIFIPVPCRLPMNGFLLLDMCTQTLMAVQQITRNRECILLQVVKLLILHPIISGGQQQLQQFIVHICTIQLILVRGNAGFIRE